MPELAEYLRSLRGELSLYQVEKATGISRSLVRRYENGERTPSVETLEKLATLYQKPFEDLLFIYFDDAYSDPRHRDSLLQWANHRLYGLEERSLLDKYRTLSPERQRQLMQTLADHHTSMGSLSLGLQ